MNFSKLTILIMMTIFSSFSFAGGEVGNGGDPYEVQALPFPNEQLMQNAMKLIKEATSTRLNRDSAYAYLVLADMTKKNKIHYIDQNIIYPSVYPNTEITGETIVLVAVSAFSVNGQIYFTPKSLELSEQEFAKLLLHETIHNWIPKSLSNDEVFVEEYARAIMNQDANSWSRNVFRVGARIQPGNFPLAQFLESFDRQIPNQKWWCGFPEYGFGIVQLQDCKEAAKTSILLKLRKIVENNIYDIELEGLFKFLAIEINRAMPVEYPSVSQLKEEILPSVLRGIIKSQGLTDLWSKYPTLTCKKDAAVCKPDDLIKIEELFKFPNPELSIL